MSSSQLRNRCCRVSHADYSHEQNWANNGTKSWTGVDPSRMICCVIHAHFALKTPHQSHSLDAHSEKNKKKISKQEILETFGRYRLDSFSFENACWRQWRIFNNNIPSIVHVIEILGPNGLDIPIKDSRDTSQGNGKFNFRILLVYWKKSIESSSLVFPCEILKASLRSSSWRLTFYIFITKVLFSVAYSDWTKSTIQNYFEDLLQIRFNTKQAE